MAAGGHLRVGCVNHIRTHFNELSVPKNDILEPNFVQIGSLVAEIWTFMVSKMAGGGHLEFGPVENERQIFARGRGPNFL